MKLQILIIFAVALLVCGCQTTAKKRALAFKEIQKNLVGKTKEELIECAGAPDRTTPGEAVEFLTYISDGDTLKRDTVIADGNNGVYVGGRSARETKLRCELTITVRTGKVSKVTYKGTTSKYSSDAGQQCYYAVQGCEIK